MTLVPQSLGLHVIGQPPLQPSSDPILCRQVLGKETVVKLPLLEIMLFLFFMTLGLILNHGPTEVLKDPIDE